MSTSLLELGDARLPDRFWSKVELDEATGCWMWTGAPSTPYGHAQFRPGGSLPKVYAHRFSYETLVASVPEGLQLDHLCRRPPCVNPAHLEPVTGRVNVIRARQLIQACPQGHAYTPDNIFVDRRGWRSCWTCRKERSRAHRLAQLAKESAA